MKNIVLTVSYEGTNYHGFQKQNNATTVQELLEGAIFEITGEKSAIIGCSRTDAGVHAEEYVCNFHTNTKIPADKIPFALNTVLPDDISCMSGRVAEEDFHARFSAKSKIYEYRIWTAPHKHALSARFSWHYPQKVNVSAMKKAALAFIGEKDFAGFMSTGGQQKTTVKEIYDLKVSKTGDMIKIKIHANGYLYNMVRIIAGTLVYVGNGKIDKNEIEEIIASKDRKRAGITAPPEGLMLKKVFY